MPLTCRRFGIDKSYVLGQAELSEDILHADYRLIPLSQFVILLQQTIQIPPSWSEQKDHTPINPELWLYRLKEMITVALPSGRVSLPMIAQQLQCHPRALQRQLKAQGLTLQSIIDDVRRMHAEHLLLDTHYDMLTISHMVGLKHQSQLSAKAMQWFGVSAQAYRKAKLEQKKAHQKVG